jgi:hypothetical protein
MFEEGVCASALTEFRLSTSITLGNSHLGSLPFLTTLAPFRFFFAAGPVPAAMFYRIPVFPEFNPALPDPLVFQLAAVVALISTFCLAGSAQLLSPPKGFV